MYGFFLRNRDNSDASIFAADAFFAAVRKLETIVSRHLTQDELASFRKPEFALRREYLREGAFDPEQARSLLTSLKWHITTGTIRRMSLSPHGIYLDGPLATSRQQNVNLYYAVRRDDCAVGVIKVYYPSKMPTASADHEWLISEQLNSVALSQNLAEFRRHAVRYANRYDLDRGRTGLFMPAYVRSLQDFLLSPHVFEQHLSLPDAFIMHTARGVLRALVVIHAAGFAHCDVKPDNIMLDGQGMPTLIDLGAATAFGAPVKEGIPIQMSLGYDLRLGSSKVDLISLAVTLWWAVFGISHVSYSLTVMRSMAKSKIALGEHRVVAVAIVAILDADTALAALEAIPTT